LYDSELDVFNQSEQKLIIVPTVNVGMLQMGPQDPNPMAVVWISYPSVEEASEMANAILAHQTGIKPFATGPDVFVGDTAVKIDISSRPSLGKGYLCQVMLKADPKHSTYLLYAASYVSEEARKVFYALYDRTNSYLFTVSCGNDLLLDTLNLIKYTVTKKGV